MSLKIKQVIAAHDALSILVSNDKENKFILPSSVRIKFALNLRKVKPVVEEFYKEYNKLVETHGEVQADGTFKVVNEEKLKVFNIERNDMLEQQTDVELSPVDFKDLGDNQLAIDLIAVLLDTGLVKE